MKHIAVETLLKKNTNSQKNKNRMDKLSFVTNSPDILRPGTYFVYQQNDDILVLITLSQVDIFFYLKLQP